MATFLATIRFTEQGLKTVRDTTKRASAFKAAAKKLSVKVTSVYWSLGSFDGVLVFEAPDVESATAAMLHLCAAGNVKTQTVQLFTAAEMDKILASNGA
jgi:uncharacterized protein with GYD domain